MNKTNLFGIVFTAIVSIALLLAIFAWLNLYKEPEVSISKIKENEIATYLNLKKIAVAQQKYIKEDWNNDGKFEYSEFLVHLYKTVISKNGDTKLLRYVPKKLGFATESSTALNGYVFMPLYFKNGARNTLERKDYTKEWAVYASPWGSGQTGRLKFIIDQTGNIMISETKEVYKNDYPYMPLQNEWKLLKSIDDLSFFHENTEYPIPK